MARVTIIDIPDHQVDAVLRAVQTLSGGTSAPPPMVVHVPPALPAPAAVDPEPYPEPAPVRHANWLKRQAAAHPRAAKAPGIAARILGALPGTLERICERTGFPQKQVRQNMYLLVKAGKAVREGDVWRVPGSQLPHPQRPAGKRGKKPEAPAAAAGPEVEREPERMQTTAEVFAEVLGDGPHTTQELFSAARSEGKPVPDAAAAERILMNMERQGKVERFPAGRWALVKVTGVAE